MALGRLRSRSALRAPVRRSHPAPVVPLHRGPADHARSDQARRIQAVHRGWLVMWSAWHRTFTAFSYFAPVPLVLDEPTPDALIIRMRQAELHYSTRLNARRF
jgi:hypothetical protein